MVELIQDVNRYVLNRANKGFTMNFNISNYVVTIAKQKVAETALVTATNTAKQGHVEFFNHLTVTPANLETIRANALTELQANAGALWPSEAGKGFVGYQKASKAGCCQAVAYNRFCAWSVTNVSKDGLLLTSDEKDAIKTAKDEKAVNDKQSEKDAIIAQALEGTVDASLLVPITVESSIEFLLAHGFVQTILKNGTLTLTLKK